MKTYYVVTTKNGFIELRQTRFKVLFDKGTDHPHDVCATARSESEIRDMLRSVAIDAESVDWEVTA